MNVEPSEAYRRLVFPTHFYR